MELNQEIPHDHFFIRAVSEKGIRIDDEFYHQPFVITGRRIVPEWEIESVQDLNETSLQVLFDLQPEVVLIGTGKTQVFLPPAVQAHFFRRNIGFEVMTTDAACRTFNVLASEGRHVVAGLIPVIS